MNNKEEKGRDKLGDWAWDIHTAVYKIDNKGEPTV